MKKKLLILLVMMMSFTLFSGFVYNEGIVDLTTPVSTEESTEAVSEPEPTTETTQAPSTTESDFEDENIKDDVMGDDYEFGDDIVAKPNEDIGGFFKRLQRKFLEGLNGFQIIVGIILAICFVVCIICAGISLFTNRKNFLWYILGLILICVLFVLDLYAVPIMQSFKNWFMS